MTTHTTHRAGRRVTSRAAGPDYRDHTVTGTATQLANLVANHRSAGTLVAMTAPRPVTADRFQVVIRLRRPASAGPTVRVTSIDDHVGTRTRPPRQRTRIAVIAATVTGTITGLLAVAAYLLGQLVELITGHAAPILGVLALAALLAGLTARRSGRRHCPGC